MQEREKEELIKEINKVREELSLTPYPAGYLETKEVEELRKLYHQYFLMREEYKKKLKEWPKFGINLKFLIIIAVPTSILIFIILFQKFQTIISVTKIPEKPTSPIGIWHFDEGSGFVVKDLSGNENVGIINGATWVDGKFGKALKFDGIDDYVQLPYINIFNQKPFTVMGWVWQNTIRTNQPFFSVGDNVTKDRYLHLLIRDGHPHFGFFEDDLTSSTLLTTNTWYHLAFVWEGLPTNKQIIYINGKKDSEGITNGTLVINSGNSTGNGIWIGRFINSYYDGIIDEVYIYDKPLKEEEIKNFYQKAMKEK
jgi:hypothetical protein